MSGIVTGVDYTMLFAGSTSSAFGATTDPILSALYSPANGTSGDPMAALKQAQTNATQDVAAQAKTPSVAHDIAAFQKGIASAKTIQQALQNPDVLKVLLTANNLASQIGFPALAQQALMSDPSNTKSLANQLSATNSNWLSTAKTYNFFKNGLAELQNPSVQSTLTNAYAEISWQNSLNAKTPGLSYALQFIKQASSITSVDQILGDPVNWEVVLTALNIPPQIAYQDLTAREIELNSHINVKQLQDPKFVTSLTDQYLLNKQQAAASSTTSTSLDALAIQAAGLVV